MFCRLGVATALRAISKHPCQRTDVLVPRGNSSVSNREPIAGSEEEVRGTAVSQPALQAAGWLFGRPTRLPYFCRQKKRYGFFQAACRPSVPGPAAGLCNVGVQRAGGRCQRYGGPLACPGSTLAFQDPSSPHSPTRSKICNVFLSLMRG